MNDIDNNSDNNFKHKNKGAINNPELKKVLDHLNNEEFGNKALLRKFNENTIKVNNSIIEFKKDIIENFDSKMTEQRNNVGDILFNAIDKFRVEKDSIVKSIHKISEKKVHDIVNGQLVHVNECLEIIDKKIDRNFKKYDDNLDKLFKKTILGKVINGLTNKPFKTVTIITMIVCISILVILHLFGVVEHIDISLIVVKLFKLIF